MRSGVLKFVRRNRVAVALATLALLATVAGLVGTMIQARRAEEQALSNQRRFQQVRQLATKVLSLDSVISRVPGSTKARHEIVAISREYLESLAPEARTDPDLAIEIGKAYHRLAMVQGTPGNPGLGQYAAAEENLRKAEALLEPVVGASHGNRQAALTLIDVSESLTKIVRLSDRRREEAIALARKTAQVARQRVYPSPARRGGRPVVPAGLRQEARSQITGSSATCRPKSKTCGASWPRSTHIAPAQAAVERR